MNLITIAHYHSLLPTKFGTPRQSGLVPELRGRIVFEPQYSNAEALRGIEGFDYLWLIWGFSLNGKREGEWSPLVRPPLLGGNETVGVFATRSPFRPNPLGLSSVRLIGVEKSADSIELIVSGVDFPIDLQKHFSKDHLAALYKVLELDPRPQYHNDPERVYGMPFAGYDVRFTVSLDSVLHVIDVVRL